MRKAVLLLSCVVLLTSVLAVVGRAAGKAESSSDPAKESSQATPGLVVHYLHPDSYPETHPEAGYVGPLYDVSGVCPPDASLTLRFACYNPGYLGLDNLRIFHYSSGSWIGLPTTMDKVKGTLTAKISELGIYVVSAIHVPDAEAPTVRWLKPAEGAKVGEHAELIVDARDNVGVYQLTFYLDEQEIATDTSNMDGSWGAKVDLSPYAPGPHTLKVVAEDYAGNSIPATRKIVLQSSGHAPVVTIDRPVYDSARGCLIVRGSASDADGDHVDVGLALDDLSLLGIAEMADGRWSYPLILFPPGPHTITAAAYDSHDNKGLARITVTLPLSKVLLVTWPESPNALSEPIELHASVLGGGTVEYCFSITNTKTGAKSILRPYGAGDTYVWKPKSRGSYVLSVSVREKGKPKVMVSDQTKYSIIAPSHVKPGKRDKPG